MFLVLFRNFIFHRVSQDEYHTNYFSNTRLTLITTNYYTFQERKQYIISAHVLTVNRLKDSLRRHDTFRMRINYTAFIYLFLLYVIVEMLWLYHENCLCKNTSAHLPYTLRKIDEFRHRYFGAKICRVI